METERIIELFLGLILVALLVLGVVLVINADNVKSSSKSQPQVVNYYTEYTTNNYQNPAQTTFQGRVVYNPEKNIVYKKYDSFFDEDERELDYSSYGKTVRRKGVFGNKIYDFEVYVKNEDDFGGYFEVVYYFEDSQGRDFKESITKYLRPGEREKFVYSDFGFENEIYDWDYKIFPDTTSQPNRGYKIVYVYK